MAHVAADRAHGALLALVADKSLGTGGTSIGDTGL